MLTSAKHLTSLVPDNRLRADVRAYDDSARLKGDRFPLFAPGLIKHAHAVRDEATNGMLCTGPPLRFNLCER